MSALTDLGVTPATVGFVGDWHANTAYARKVIHRHAGRVDAWVHVGDFGYDFRHSFLDGLDDALEDAGGAPFFFVRGNHDSPDFLHMQPRDTYGAAPIGEHITWLPDGLRWSWSGLSFVAAGGAHSIDRAYRQPGVSWWAGETMSPATMLGIMGDGRVDVMVCHDTPAPIWVPMDARRGFPVEDDEASWTYRQHLETIAHTIAPRFVIHGHHHRRERQVLDATHFGRRCVVEGLGADRGEVADNVLVVDLVSWLDEGDEDYVRSLACHHRWGRASDDYDGPAVVSCGRCGAAAD